MSIKRMWLFTAFILFAFAGCKVSYSLSGASISPDVKTVSIAYFPNSAAMVSPILSSTFTDELQTKFVNQTKLELVREDGDMNFEGEIIGYTSTPTAVTADDYATQNRLTITVRVKFTNKIEPEYDFQRNFSAYEEYNSNRMLSDVESELIPEIVEQLVDDIFNAAVSNW
ncbi:MAG: LPS assembly lipoprotein LptE [Rikenellaceae bacterium]|nr:LPS assembly lipoprotein LptE [Rikenellaceae bacterium]